MSDREVFQPIRTYGKPPPKDTKQRIKPLPESADVGTQVAGSYHTFHIADLVNTNEHELSAMVNTQGAPEFQLRAESRGSSLQPRSTYPLRIMFMPSTKGAFDGVLNISLLGELDQCGVNTLETHAVKLHGAAKNADDVPAASERPTQLEMAGSVAEARMNLPDGRDVEFHNTRAHIAIHSIADAQKLGVDHVEKSKEQFKPAPTDSGFWSVLVDVALAMALGGIAGAVGKTLGKRLALAIESTPAKSEAAKYVNETLVNSLTDVVKDGIKTSGKGVVAKLSPSPFAGDAISFFIDIRRALNEVIANEKHAISEANFTIRAIETRDPARAAMMMQSIADSIIANVATAEAEQRHATLAQWMSGLSRLDAKTRNAGVLENGKPALATDPAGAFKLPYSNPRFAYSGIRGMLELRVEVDGPLDERVPSFKVLGASVDGVAQGVAGELANADLRTFPIPICFYLSKGWHGRILRDELGVVHSKNDHYDGVAEAQRHRAAVELVARILSIPLATWPVSVRTED